MRILVTADPFLPVPPKLYGGIERIIDSLVCELRTRGHEIGLLAHAESTCEADGNYSWPRAGGFLSHANVLRYAVKAFRPEVVHSFSRLAYLAPILANRTLAKVMSFQREPTPRTVRWADRLACGSLHFTGCSEYISNKGRAAGGSWTTIHNFVDVSRYTLQPRVSEDAPLVFLSRIEQIKGAHLAIGACRLACRKLIIAGNHADDESEAGEYWRREIAPKIDGDRVSYVGPVNDEQKNELLGRAAAMIVPIQWEEPFGIVFAEALACGTPVISCPRGALPEIVTNGINGFLITSLDGCFAAIEKLPSIVRAACRETVEKLFSSKLIVSEYERLYYRSIGQ